MIAPNKQNLLLMQGQYKTSQNGMKLLREKRTGLVIHFLATARKGKEIELEVQQSWININNSYNWESATKSHTDLYKDLKGLFDTRINMTSKRITGVYLDFISTQISTNKPINYRSELREIMLAFPEFFKKLLLLSQYKLHCQSISEELIKTNRQINSLEKRLQNMKHTISYIQSALMEKSNLEKATLIKLFG